MKAIDILDIDEEISPLSEEAFNIRKVLKESSVETTILEQRMWVPKGKIKWLQECDENSNFSHRWSSHQKYRAFIADIELEQGIVLIK